VQSDEGWFRLSVGAVSLAEIAAALPRVKQALAALRWDLADRLVIADMPASRSWR
jgi:hypothetical protein